MAWIDDYLAEIQRKKELQDFGVRTGQLGPPLNSPVAQRYMSSVTRPVYDFQGINSLAAPVEPTVGEAYRDKIAETARWKNQDPTALETQLRGEAGETEGRPGNGIISRIFDVISRGNYAVAEGTNRALNNESGGGISEVMDFGKGLASGFTGKDKTTFDDVLGSEGGGDMAGGWQRATLGFIGDVALDPTTYMGVGMVKGAAKGARTAGAARQVNKNTTKELAEAQASSQVRREVRKALKEQTGKKKISPAQVNREIENRILRDYVPESSRAKIDDIAESFMSDGELTLKFAGIPIARSKKAYKAGSKIANKVGRRSDGTARIPNRMFRTGAELPEGLNEILRHSQIANEGQFADQMVALKGSFIDDLTPAQRSEIMFAIDEGRNLAHIPVRNSHFGFESLEEYKQLAKKMFDDMAEEEVALGFMKSDDLVDNYVYRIYNKNRDKAKDMLDKPVAYKVSVAGTSKPDFTHGRKYVGSLAKAKADGFEPVTDIAESLAARYAKHFQAKATHQFFDTATKEFGVKPASKLSGKVLAESGLKKSHNKFTDEAYFPEHIARAVDLMDAVGSNDKTAKELLDLIDKGTGHMKFFLTAANIGFHGRNSMTDIFLNMADGVKTAKPYETAGKILGNRKARVTAQEMSRTGLVQEVPLKRIKIGKEFFTDEELWNLFIKAGGKSGYIKAEFDQMAAQIASQGGKRSFKGIRNKVQDLSETREDYFRLAHFIDAFEKGAKGKTLKMGKGSNSIISPEAYNVAAEAARKVRKFNIDYGDKTKFERKVASRVMPFYTWSRKNLPLQIELLMTRPGVMALYPKGQNALQNMLGTDENGETLIPEWIRDLAPVRLATEGKPKPSAIEGLLKAFGVPEGAAAVLPSTYTPVTDLERLDPILGNMAEGKAPNFGSAVRGLVSETNPFIKAPIEVGTGRYLFNGAEIGSPTEYLSRQIPLGQRGYNLVNQTSSTNSLNEFMRYLTGLDIRPVTDTMQQGEYRRREDVLDAIIRQIKQKELEQMMRGQ